MRYTMRLRHAFRAALFVQPRSSFEATMVVDTTTAAFELVKAHNAPELSTKVEAAVAAS